MLGAVLRALVIIMTTQFAAALLGISPGHGLAISLVAIVIAEVVAYIIGQQKEK